MENSYTGQKIIQYVPIIAGIGLLLSSLDAGIVNVGLPVLQKQLSVSAAYVSWVIGAYTLTLSSTILTFGRLSDRHGRVKYFRLGLVTFCLSSLACGFASHIGPLITCRFIQGVGAAMLQASSASLVSSLVPKEKQSAAFGVLGLMIALGPILGPPVGGLIITIAGWPWMFWINVPICVLMYIITGHLPETTAQNKIPLNLLAVFLIVLTVALLLSGLSLWATEVINTQILYLVCFICVVMFIAFVLHETTNNHPLFPARLLTNPYFATPALVTAAFGASTTVAFLFPAFFYSNIHSYASWQIGLIAMFTPLGVVIFSRIVSKYMNQVGTLPLMITGVSLMLLSLSIFTRIEPSWHLTWIVLLLLIYGTGAGFFQAPSIASMMHAGLDSEQSTISAINRMLQNLSIALGSTLFTVFVDSHKLIMPALRQGWTAALILLFISSLGFLAFIKPMYQNSENVGDHVET